MRCTRALPYLATAPLPDFFSGVRKPRLSPRRGGYGPVFYIGALGLGEVGARPRASPRMVNYYIRHGSDPEGSNCMDYYRAKHMLHHLFVNQEHLLLVDGQIYEFYIGAFQACAQSHTHPEAEARIRVTPSITMSTSAVSL
ncbi:hypothetical protein V8E54_008631 [Elaphomyces granulatus]